VLLEKIKLVSGLDTDQLSESEFSNLLLYGDPKLTNEQNFLIIQATIEYIRKSKRFSKFEAFLNLPTVSV